MIRFRFELTPIGEIVPWGVNHDQLHWFALTDGWYWIELNEVELLCYSPNSPAGQAGEGPGRPYVDYYLARFWEDLIGLTPSVLQPVPDDLVEFIASDDREWTAVDRDEGYVAADWYGHHELNLGYLRHPPKIRAWRTLHNGADEVMVSWRHRARSGIRFTAPRRGTEVITTVSFVDAITDLDRSLIAAMAGRIAELERTGPPLGVEMDPAALVAEHADRANWLARRLGRNEEVDWAAVRAGAHQLLSSAR